MFDRAYDKQVLARNNPALCYMLEVVKPRLIPRAYKLHVQFDTVTVGQTLDAELRKPMCNDAWIWDLEYIIRTPNAWVGTAWKPTYDKNQTLAPFIDVMVSIMGCESGCGASDTLNITDVQMPIEMVMKPGHVSGHHETVFGNWRSIQKDMQLHIDFWLMRTLNNAGSALEIPYEVIVVAKMFEFDKCCRMCDLDMQEVYAKLAEMGLRPSSK